jgi:lysozyme
MILDLEDTSSGNLMSIEEAAVFMDYVYEKTRRIPVIYANHSVTLKLNQKIKNNNLFQQSKLWYARFKSSISDFPKGVWSEYFLWQFSSEINCSKTGTCLYNVPGTKFDMDVNVFYGSRKELEEQWNNR